MLPVQCHPAETETGGDNSKCGRYWVLGEMEIQNTRSEIIIPNLNHSVSFIHSVELPRRIFHSQCSSTQQH